MKYARVWDGKPVGGGSSTQLSISSLFFLFLFGRFRLLYEMRGRDKLDPVRLPAHKTRLAWLDARATLSFVADDSFDLLTRIHLHRFV